MFDRIKFHFWTSLSIEECKANLMNIVKPLYDFTEPFYGNIYNDGFAIRYRKDIFRQSYRTKFSGELIRTDNGTFVNGKFSLEINSIIIEFICLFFAIFFIFTQIWNLFTLELNFQQILLEIFSILINLIFILGINYIKKLRLETRKAILKKLKETLVLIEC